MFVDMFKKYCKKDLYNILYFTLEMIFTWKLHWNSQRKGVFMINKKNNLLTKKKPIANKSNK